MNTQHGSSLTSDVAVIGAGLIGSAAAKYLAQGGVNVTLIGAEPGNRHGIHASHYDEARITRLTSPDPVWAHLAHASQSRYAAIEEESGIHFHTACGHLRGDLPIDHPKSELRAMTSTLSSVRGDVVPVTSAEVSHLFPYLRFAEGTRFHYEPSPSGIINPRRLIEAQLSIGRKNGMIFKNDVAFQVKRIGTTWHIRTGEGSVSAERLLLCTGTYGKLMPDVVPVPLDLRIRPETVLLAEVGPEIASSFEHMPGIIWNFDDHPTLPYAYVLPPVLYPDGRTWIKIGADHDRDVDISSVSLADSYMRSEGSAQTAQLLKERVTTLIPSLDRTEFRSKPCLLTYTWSGYPFVDEIQSNCWAALGGCGKSAKSSDQIGRMAAQLILDEHWDQEFSRTTFRHSRKDTDQRE